MADVSAAVNRTVVERKSDLELVVTRTVNAPARIVFEAWSKADLFQRWWIPKSAGLTLLSCEMDVRTGGGYRLLFNNRGAFDRALRLSYGRLLSRCCIRALRNIYVISGLSSRSGPAL